ncbi:MAG: c-type cytochrome [Bacteroidetes bacterium]|nr:c-type cytochrome [Bacteroidota bacterium]
MKNLKTILASAAIVATCVMFSNSVSAQSKPKGKPWPVAAADASKKNPMKSDAGSIGEGKELYNQHCKSCHGAKGKGDGTKAEKIDISCGDFTSAEMDKVSDGEWFYKMTEGRKPMPSYKEKMSDNERWKVINYMRSLK